MSDHLTPVEVCERLIGPLPVLERIVGYRPKAGYGWKRSSQGRAAGEFPSARIMRQLLDHCRADGIAMKPDWLIYGASLDEIRDIEAAVAFQRQIDAAALRPEAAE